MDIPDVIYKFRVLFSKTGDMKFISHLDLVRLFQRALRRAGLPVVMTKGFSPRIKMSITRALKLGIESESEEATFYLSEKLPPRLFTDTLNAKLPNGIKITGIEEI
ncbi:MAG: DUF2344 domain-containing protein [Candidatus Omnitrophica bacterium]|nr:DUF2344 domain-containing protein [Candidatus Omnitrophota bacterium]